MSFFNLVSREIATPLWKLVLMSGLGGISNAAILAAINSGAESAGSGDKSVLWAFVLFLVSLLIFIKSQVYVATTTAAEIEAIIHRLRVRLLNHIRRSELLVLEKIGRSKIMATISSDAAVLTQASNMLAFAVQSPVLIFFVALYVAYLSLAAFLLSIAIVGLAATIFHLRSRQLTAQKAMAADQERRLFDLLADFLDGFKEVRLNKARSDALFHDAVEVSRGAANIKINSQAETFRQMLWAQSYLYILLGAVVFVAPQFSKSLGGGSITQVTTALLYVIGACFGLVQTIPVLLNANAAAARMEQLDAALRASVTTEEEEALPRIARRFEVIEMRDIVFRYVDKFSHATFQIGPLDFDLRSGDLVFITGGNGSGKSTFLKVLAGLYPPDAGDISFDGMRVDDETRDDYRALMSAVFSDYHLFRQLYGIADPAQDEIDRLLAQFRLSDKTELSHGEFRTLDLSGGQRKRLALIVSLLEKRPVLLLDEWTAEQDPEFRRKFYETLLPEFMRAGATIVAITHDDRYLDELALPARRISMDEGRIVGQRTAAQLT